jgi:hypothetical protein
MILQKYLIATLKNVKPSLYLTTVAGRQKIFDATKGCLQTAFSVATFHVLIPRRACIRFTLIVFASS